MYVYMYGFVSLSMLRGEFSIYLGVLPHKIHIKLSNAIEMVK